MADLNDLKSFANDVKPMIQDLVKELADSHKPPDVTAETEAIDTLKQLLAQATQSTPRTPGQCADALSQMHAALTEILIQANTNPLFALPDTQKIIIKEQRLAIEDALGQVVEIASLQPLATLLPPRDLAQISADLQAARAGIQQKKSAQAVLDTVVDVVIIASKIAVKVATA
jgi:hypothetical protein